MTGASQTRGRPLLALALLMVAWVGFRTVFWSSAAISEAGVHTSAFAHGDKAAAPHGYSSATMALAGPQSLPGEGYYSFTQVQPAPYGPAPLHAGRDYRQEWRYAPHSRAIARDYRPQPFFWGGYDPFASPSRAAPPEPVDRPVPVRMAMAHQLMWMAAVSRMPLPAELFTRSGRDAPAMSGGFGLGSGSEGRWSMDAWMLHRKGGRVSLANGVLPATYGASQFGAVLRYRLAPQSRLRPTAYLRTTSALNGSQENEAAAGLSVRPLAKVPVVVAAEMRATSRPGSSQLRPAVLAWTEMPPINLPMGARGEFYAQAGYVGGKFKTPFADGQLRVDRGVVNVGRTELRAGGGAWAGVQKGASRVDVGPSATFGMPISKSASARVAVDWRFRVTGNAEPKSGPAVTLSAGF